MFIKVNGARLFFDVEGASIVPDGPNMREKPTVILAHGGPGSDHTTCKPYFSQLSDIAQVIYYDHRGNGRSEHCENATWTLDQWGDDLAGICDALGIEKPIVLGTSFGGFVAQSYARRHPGHASKLILISTAAKVEFPAIYQAFERLAGPDIREIAQTYWEKPTPESRARYREQCIPFYRFNKGGSQDWKSRIKMNNDTAMWFNGPKNEHGKMDYRADLSRINAPTLVMVGEEDPITPSEFSDVIVDNLRAEITTYKKYTRCGHGVVHDRPAEALTEIRKFILSK
jgi:proline iminopeptidase